MSFVDFESEAAHWAEEDNKRHEQNEASSSQFDPFQGMEAVPEPEAPPFKAEPMTVRVDDPQKGGSFVTYRLFTMTALENYSTSNRPVRRRFKDFIWLHNALSIEFPTSIVPPLPEKHRLKFFKGNWYDPLFLEQRRLGLQWFMDRLAGHPCFQRSQYTRLFLESTDFEADKSIQTKSVPSSNFFVSLFHSKSKVKKPDEKFEEMKDLIEKFQDNLFLIEKLYSKVGKRQQVLQNNYIYFAASIRGLSALETNIDQQLRQFAESVEHYANEFKKRRYQEELLFLNKLHEVYNYCNVAKEKLAERDEKQVTFENMSTELQAIVLEREKALYPGTDLGTTLGTDITETVTDKIVDMGKARTEKIAKLESKINQLGQLVAKAADDNNSYSTQMIKEFRLFTDTKESELKQSLVAYADCYIEFYGKSISIWNNILPILEQIQ
ncbi:hypothetical protein BY458DRAFT_559103 [Sporodiniella umbellata]|nr:hypothetical protein BY458DRAFT_559103 [Sporodiniella umbellata]